MACMPFVAKLNDRVARKSARFIEDAQKNGAELPPEVESSMRPMTALYCGSPVYAQRNEALVYTFSLIGLAFIGNGVLSCGLPCASVCCVLTYLIYDAYSGVLHVCLDDPANLKMPILGQPCLEFQWHHHIPDDIVVKPFMQSCADLNLVVFANLIGHFFTTAKMGTEPLILMLLGFKMLAAYFGQFSHRCAHMGLSQRGPLINRLQTSGVMTTFAKHRVHHTPPHDSNFCLLGPCNDFVQFLSRMIPGTVAWRCLFAAWSILDITVIAAIVSTCSEAITLA